MIIRGWWRWRQVLSKNALKYKQPVGEGDKSIKMWPSWWAKWMFNQYGEQSHIQGQTIDHSREDDHSYLMENNQLSYGKCP